MNNKIALVKKFIINVFVYSDGGHEIDAHRFANSDVDGQLHCPILVNKRGDKVRASHPLTLTFLRLGLRS